MLPLVSFTVIQASLASSVVSNGLLTLSDSHVSPWMALRVSAQVGAEQAQQGSEFREQDRSHHLGVTADQQTTYYKGLFGLLLTGEKRKWFFPKSLLLQSQHFNRLVIMMFPTVFLKTIVLGWVRLYTAPLHLLKQDANHTDVIGLIRGREHVY